MRPELTDSYAALFSQYIEQIIQYAQDDPRKLIIYLILLMFIVTVIKKTRLGLPSMFQAPKGKESSKERMITIKNVGDNKWEVASGGMFEALKGEVIKIGKS